MSKKEKLIEKIKKAKIADFEDIHLLLTQLGFTWRNVGSHYTYTNAPFIVQVVRHGKQVKRVYLKNLQELFEDMGL